MALPYFDMHIVIIRLSYFSVVVNLFLYLAIKGILGFLQRVYEYVRDKITKYKYSKTNQFLKNLDKELAGLHRQFAMLYQSAKDNEQQKTTDTDGNGGEKYSVILDNKNRKIVYLDRNIFTDVDISQRGDALENWIIDNFGGQKYNTQDYRFILVNERTAGKMKFWNEDMDETAYKRKLYAAEHIDELISISKHDRHSQNIKEKHKDFAKHGWDYFKTYFTDGSRVYEVDMSTAKTDEGSVLYNIGIIKDVGKFNKKSPYSLTGSPNELVTIHSNVAKNKDSNTKIPQNDDGVNTYSMQDTEKYSLDDGNKSNYNLNRGDIDDGLEQRISSDESARSNRNGNIKQFNTMDKERPRTKRITVSGNSYEVINSSAETAEQRRLKEQNKIELGIDTYYTIDLECMVNRNTMLIPDSAFEKAKKHPNPEELIIKNAMYRTDIGNIDFVLGTPGEGNKFKRGYGLSHIIEKRNSENGYGEQTLDKLIDVIAKATDVEIQRNSTNLGNDRIKLNYDNYTAVLSQSPHGNHWLLTGWINKKEAMSYANGEVRNSSEATAVAPTFTRHNRVDETASKYSISNNSEKVNNSSTQNTEKYSVDDNSENKNVNTEYVVEYKNLVKALENGEISLEEFRNATNELYYTAGKEYLTEILDKHGNDVVVAIHLNKYENRTIVNKIASLYSKTNDYGNNRIISYVTNQIEQGNLIDVSNKKAPNWFTSRGLQLPKLVQTILDANNKLAQKKQSVNTHSMQDTEKYSVDDGNKSNYNLNRGDIDDRPKSISSSSNTGRENRNGASQRFGEMGLSAKTTKKIDVNGVEREVIRSSAETAEQRRIKEQNKTEFGIETYFGIEHEAIEFENEIYPLYLNVGKAKNDGNYHIYDITKKLRDTAHRVNDVGRLSKSFALQNSASTNSIGHKSENVNSKYSLDDESIEYLLDEYKAGNITKQEFMEQVGTEKKETLRDIANLTKEDASSTPPKKPTYY